jgi:hypothetical protein
VLRLWCSCVQTFCLVVPRLLLLLLSPGLLEDRLERVYKADPRYSDKATSMFNIDLGAPEVRCTGQGVC